MSGDLSSNSEVSQAPKPTSYVVEGNTYRELIAERDRLRVHLRQKSEQIARLQDGIEKMQQDSDEKSTHEPPAALGKLEVFNICIAYESGFGHGTKGDELPNPYRQGTEAFEAYFIGYSAGQDAKRGATQLPSDTRWDVNYQPALMFAVRELLGSLPKSHDWFNPDAKRVFREFLIDAHQR